MGRHKSSVYQKDTTLEMLLEEVLKHLELERPIHHSDYNNLKDTIIDFFNDRNTDSNKAAISIGISTLKRLWGYDGEYPKPFDISKLNILSWIAEYDSWYKYVAIQQSLEKIKALKVHLEEKFKTPIKYDEKTLKIMKNLNILMKHINDYINDTESLKDRDKLTKVSIYKIWNLVNDSDNTQKPNYIKQIDRNVVNDPDSVFNTLALICDYEGWSDFCKKYDNESTPIEYTFTKSNEQNDSDINQTDINQVNIPGPVLETIAKMHGYKNLDDLFNEGANQRSIWQTSVNQFNDADKLDIGEIIILGSEYGRYVKLEYIGDRDFMILEYKGRGNRKVGDVIAARWFEIIEPNFKDYQNAEIDIIGLMDDLDSKTEVNDRDIMYYERLQL